MDNDTEVCALCGKPFASDREYWASNEEFEVRVGPDCWRRIKKAGRAGVMPVAERPQVRLYDPRFYPEPEC
jgi:hypothetical protein